MPPNNDRVDRTAVLQVLDVYGEAHHARIADLDRCERGERALVRLCKPNGDYFDDRDFDSALIHRDNIKRMKLPEREAGGLLQTGLVEAVQRGDESSDRHFTELEAEALQGRMIADVSREGMLARVTGMSRFETDSGTCYAIGVHWNYEAFHSEFAESGPVYFNDLANDPDLRLLEGAAARRAAEKWAADAPAVWRGAPQANDGCSLDRARRLEQKIADGAGLPRKGGLKLG